MRTIVPVLAMALALSGCATMNSDPGQTCSSETSCVVTVTVRGCSWKNIDVQPEELHVKRGHKGEIAWKLVAPPGWAFAANGIEFKQPGNPDFKEGRKGAREFRWFDANSKPGRHAYNVNVTPPDGGAACTRDPTIMNDGEGP
jgi:hypothetical protein